jgi:uncharacterized membrane protein HdeD (DUF308 family)/uncharacterized membrane protein YjdF
VTAHAVPHPGWDRRRILYGDWSWLVRDGLDVARLAFFGGTIVFATQGRSDVVALTAASIVLLVARIVNLPRWFDFGLIMAMSLIAWGTALHLYGQWQYYDKVVHSLSPLAYAPVLYFVVVRLGVVPDPGEAIRQGRVARISGIFIITLALGMAVGAFYENIEWIEDKFGILGGHFVKGLWDTETDLLCDAAGSIAGATFLTVWSLRGWSSHRVTVVPVPAPAATPLEVAGKQLESGPGARLVAWAGRIAGLPRVAQGSIFLAGGVLLLALPEPSLRTVGLIVGSALLAYAVIELVEIVNHPGRAARTPRVVTTIACAIAGTLVLAWPTISQLALLRAAGAASLVLGGAEAAAVSSKRDTRERWVGAAASAAAYVFGIALLATPGKSLHRVINLLGIYLVVLGALRLLRALEVWLRER